MRAVLLVATAAACSRDSAPSRDFPSSTSDGVSSTDSKPTTPGDTGSAAVADPAWSYVLFAPMDDRVTWLVDSTGAAVHRWDHDGFPADAVYLLDDGSLLRPELDPAGLFDAGGAGGIVQRVDWDGNVTWEYRYSADDHLSHHDVALLPDGHVLLLAWQVLGHDALVGLGRDPTLVGADGWMEHVIEVDPVSNGIVWEWHLEDHLAQDRNPTAAGYVPDVSLAPGKVDVDFGAVAYDPDWIHLNAIDYNASLDQIVVSSERLSEVWVLAHGTSTADSAGPAGDLLYRWGHPAVSGGAGEEQLYHQHDAHWIDDGLPGAGNLLLFDNGDPELRPSSRVVELTPPLQPDGSYGDGPDAPTWQYTGDGFYSSFLGGAQRQPEGTTLVCLGPAGDFWGVDPDGAQVWSFPFGRTTFRAERYPADFAGFDGRDLTRTGELPGLLGTATTR